MAPVSHASCIFLGNLTFCTSQVEKSVIWQKPSYRRNGEICMRVTLGEERAFGAGWAQSQDFSLKLLFQERAMEYILCDRHPTQGFRQIYFI